MTNTRSISGPARRHEIARAARSILAEKGMEGLRTRAVADAVGINIATLHYHVGCKDGLLKLVTEAIRDDFVAMHVTRPREGLSASACLRLEFIEYRDVRAANSETVRALAELKRQAIRDSSVAALLAPLRKAWRDDFREILKDGRATGEFRADLDPETFADIIIATLDACGNDEAYAETTAMSRLFSELFRSVLAPPLKEDFREFQFD